VDGPATRPITSLAVKNSVGKPAAREAPNVGVGKESVVAFHIYEILSKAGYDDEMIEEVSLALTDIVA
jgi:hypothetical protein